MGKVNQELTFSKNWENATDFPTYCDNEARVRADIQLLYDEIKNYINQKLRPAINTIEASEIETSDDSNVQEDLDSLRSDLNGTVLGQIPNESLTGAKMVPGTLLDDVESDLTITAIDMGGHPCTLSGSRFMFSPALGMMFVTGVANFTRSSGSSFIARFEVTGPYYFGYHGSVCSFRSAAGDANVEVSYLGSKLQIDVTVSNVLATVNDPYVDFSFWFFCEEVSP